MTKKIVITENPMEWPFFTVGKDYEVIYEDDINLYVIADDGSKQFIGIPETNPDTVKYKEVQERAEPKPQPKIHPDEALQAVRDCLNDCGMELLRIKVLTQDNNIVKG